MFDTMTITKITGAFCGTLLIYLLGHWAAEALYSTEGHGGEEQAYVIDTGADEAETDEAAAEVSFDAVLASADPAAGEKLFSKCKACHKLDGSDGTGPHLNGVVGRAIGAVDGFRYSGALGALGDAWTPEALNAFLENPRSAAKGTSMSFAGLAKVEDRANLIAFLQGTGG